MSGLSWHGGMDVDGVSGGGFVGKALVLEEGMSFARRKMSL